MRRETTVAGLSPAFVKADLMATEKVQLIKMTRPAGNGPTEADVHPDEAENYQAGGWRVATEQGLAIPANFPGAVALANAGITEFAQLAGATGESLTTIKGIGAATAELILAELGK